MERLTKDNPQENFETMMNYVFAKDGWAHIRHDGESEDVPLTTWAKAQCIKRGYDESPGETAKEIDETLCDCLMDGDGCPVALAYCFACQASHLRDRLKSIEDILGDVYDLDHLREIKSKTIAEEKRRACLADMRAGKTLDGVPVGVVLPKLDMESLELKEMPEYIEREAAIKVIRSKAEVYEIRQGDALEGFYVADCEIGGLPSDDVVSAEEFALLEAKNEVLGQENDRLKAEIKRLHGENFWLTGGLGREE